MPEYADDNDEYSKQSNRNLRVVNEDCDFRTVTQLVLHSPSIKLAFMSFNIDITTRTNT